MAVSPDYMKQKLKEWKTSWNTDTIESMNGTQLESVYIQERQKVMDEIKQKVGIKDFRGIE